MTVRDWFNLGLKEGLTQLQEQLFAEDVQTAAAIAAAELQSTSLSNTNTAAFPTIHERVLQLLESNNLKSSGGCSCSGTTVQLSMEKDSGYAAAQG